MKPLVLGMVIAYLLLPVVKLLENKVFKGIKGKKARRNLAVILELAAMNNRQKKMGYNAAEMLAAEHDHAIDSGLF